MFVEFLWSFEGGERGTRNFTTKKHKFDFVVNVTFILPAPVEKNDLIFVNDLEVRIKTTKRSKI